MIRFVFQPQSLPDMLPILLATALGPLSQVHVVRNEVEFLAALQSASPGDTVLVEDGFLLLNEAVVLDKGLNITSGLAFPFTLSAPNGVTVENLPADQRAVFRNVRFRTTGNTQIPGFFPGPAALAVRDCSGSVHVFGGEAQAILGYPGLRVERSHQVFVSDADLLGGDSFGFVGASVATDAGPGLFAEDATIHLENCTVVGNDGSNDCSGSVPVFVEDPAPGAELIDTTLLATDCTFEGGDGSFLACVSSPCVGFDGEPGLVATGQSFAQLERCVSTGGISAVPAPCPGSQAPATSGFQGPNAVLVETDLGVSQTLDPWAGSPGDPATLSVRSAPGDLAVVLVGIDWLKPVPISGVELYLDLASSVPLSLGVVDAAGLATGSFALPSGTGGTGSLELWVQAFGLDATGPPVLRESAASSIELP